MKIKAPANQVWETQKQKLEGPSTPELRGRIQSGSESSRIGWESG